MKALPYTRKAYDLLHQGSIVLAQVEANGIRVDGKYLDQAIADLTKTIAKKRRRLQKSEVVRAWKKMFRGRTNLDSNDQLGKVLFERMGFVSPALTATGKYKTDEGTLASVDHPFVKDWLAIKKLLKARDTFLAGIKSETANGYLHPVFNLHLVLTFRSSSDSPNFQNFPVRNEVVSKIVRRSLTARKGRRLIEIDYRGVEVCMAACYNRDPNLITYIKDKSKDMHRDMASECYLVPREDMLTKDEAGAKAAKKLRYCAKNKLVFPQFYGSWYPDCAEHLWGAIDQMGLTTPDGVPLKKHLRQHGIVELGDLRKDRKESPREGTFERHIMLVEKKLWGPDFFAVYAQWKKDSHEDYKRKGWIKSKTGFIIQGWMKKNEVLNYAVQGSAFHLLLWSLIEIQAAITRRGLKTLLIGQIHDSILADVPEDELEEFAWLCHEIMTQKVVQHWKWICVPLEIEIEATPVGGAWCDKEPMKIGFET